jgi:hypothetical protein
VCSKAKQNMSGSITARRDLGGTVSSMTLWKFLTPSVAFFSVSDDYKCTSLSLGTTTEWVEFTAQPLSV